MKTGCGWRLAVLGRELLQSDEEHVPPTTLSGGLNFCYQVTIVDIKAHRTIWEETHEIFQRGLSKETRFSGQLGRLGTELVGKAGSSQGSGTSAETNSLEILYNYLVKVLQGPMAYPAFVPGINL